MQGTRFLIATVCLFQTVSALAGGGTVIRDDTKVLNGPIYIVSNRDVESVSYPNLEFVNGPIYIVANSNLATVELPKLTFVNGPIYITYNTGLRELAFSKTATVNGPFYYYGNGKAVVTRPDSSRD